MKFVWFDDITNWIIKCSRRGFSQQRNEWWKCWYGQVYGCESLSHAQWGRKEECGVGEKFCKFHGLHEWPMQIAPSSWLEELAAKQELSYFGTGNWVARKCLLNEPASDPSKRSGNAGHGRSIASDNSDHGSERLSKNAEKQQVKPATTRVYTFTAWKNVV